MRKLLLILLVIFMPTLSYGAIVTGGIEYNQEIAAEEVFKNPVQNVSFDIIKNYLVDLNNYENINALEAGIETIKDRKLAQFSDGTYGIVYLSNPTYSWYYAQNGRLISFTLKTSLDYPCKITKYKPDGSVINTGLKISEEESYIFSPNGDLIAHWKGNFCFDKNNKIIMTRKYF